MNIVLRDKLKKYMDKTEKQEIKMFVHEIIVWKGSYSAVAAEFGKPENLDKFQKFTLDNKSIYISKDLVERGEDIDLDIETMLFMNRVVIKSKHEIPQLH